MAASAPAVPTLYRRLFQGLVTTLYLVGIAVLALRTLAASGGRLIYALDDPYIHLALAETIARGGYGINLGEFASPSSSILYPLILAGTTLAGLGEWGPLVVGVLAEAALAFVLAGFVFRLVDGGASPWRFAVLALMAPILLLAVNALSLPLMGMEHPLHVLASVLVLAGLHDMVRDGRPPPLLPVAIVLCALIRFEGLALALAAIAAMAAERHLRAATATLSTVVAALAVYGFAMSAMGLPLLPSSVLIKSGASAALVEGEAASLIGQVAANLMVALRLRIGVLMVVTAVVIAGALLVHRHGPAGRERRAAMVVGVVALAALVAHLLVGQFGWFSRYEVYAVAIMIVALVVVLAPALRRFGAPALAVLAVFLGVIADTYSGDTLRTPAAARNIYQQQFQMHRFATDYFPQPVAVNDLGWVSYRNDGLVLDLWGLGSEQARRLTRSQGRTAQTLLQLTADRGIAYAMIYEDGFAGAIPPAWCRLATLHTSRITTGSADVAFYAIDLDKAAAMRQALEAFAPTLPEGARLELAGERAAPATDDRSAGPGRREGCENPADALQSGPG